MAWRISASLGSVLCCQQRAAGHHHARRAEAALQAVLLPEALLERVQLAVLLQALDGRDLAAVGLHREHGARLDRLRRRAARCRRRSGWCRSRCGCRSGVSASRRKWTRSRRDSTSRLLRGAVDRRPGSGAVAMALVLPGPARRPAVSARAVSTRAMSRLYSTEPRRSALGEAAAAASRRRLGDRSSVGVLADEEAARPSVAWIGVGPALVRPMPTLADLAARAERQLRRGGGGGEVADLALELDVGAAAAWRRDGDADLGQDLVRARARSRRGRGRTRRSGWCACRPGRSPPPRRAARAWWPGGRWPDRRGRGCRRRSPGCAPAGRRSPPAVSASSG